MRQFFANVSYWKVATIRAGIYMLIVGITDFLTNTETWSDRTWSDTGPFLLTRLFMGTAVAMFTVLVAFLDTTMTELRNQRGAETTTFVETQTVIQDPPKGKDE